MINDPSNNNKYNNNVLPWQQMKRKKKKKEIKYKKGIKSINASFSCQLFFCCCCFVFIKLNFFYLMHTSTFGVVCFILEIRLLYYYYSLNDPFTLQANFSSICTISRIERYANIVVPPFSFSFSLCDECHTNRSTLFQKKRGFLYYSLSFPN